MSEALRIENLSVAFEDTLIVPSVSLTVHSGEIHALMGPNGSGKSTLAAALMGHPSYTCAHGSITVWGKELIGETPDIRAKAGLFLAFQYPYEIEGVKVGDFLRQAYNALYGGTEKQIGIRAFQELLASRMELLGIDKNFAERSLNVGFSGGEKKRLEMLQIAVLQPRVLILDEIDSGLDVDALRAVSHALLKVKREVPGMSVVIITHYTRILEYVRPDFVHVLVGGEIVKSGSAELATEIEKTGYENLI